jgi:hypothetical protein
MHLCDFDISTPMTHAARDNTTDTASQARYLEHSITDTPSQANLQAPHQAQAQQLREPGQGHGHALGSGAPVHGYQLLKAARARPRISDNQRSKRLCMRDEGVRKVPSDSQAST